MQLNDEVNQKIYFEFDTIFSNGRVDKRKNNILNVVCLLLCFKESNGYCLIATTIIKYS